MTGFLVAAGLILVLALALGPAHRRATLAWRPGLDTRDDRDLARLQDDLRFADPGPLGPRHPTVPFDDPPGPEDATLATRGIPASVATGCVGRPAEPGSLQVDPGR